MGGGYAKWVVVNIKWVVSLKWVVVNINGLHFYRIRIPRGMQIV